MATPSLDPLLLMAPFIRRSAAAPPPPGPAVPDPRRHPRHPPTRPVGRGVRNGLAPPAQRNWGGRAFVACSAGGFLLVAGCVVYGVARLFT